VIVGIGLDVLDLARVERLLTRRGDHALRRLCSPAELEYIRRHSDRVRHFAARIAAKEATFKALARTEGARAIGWRDMEVVSGADGQPSLALHGAARACAASLGVTRAWITLSHSAMSAVAVVVLEGAESVGGGVDGLTGGGPTEPRAWPGAG
jgi:holo-[acyl-carrier protein] synthase